MTLERVAIWIGFPVFTIAATFFLWRKGRAPRSVFIWSCVFLAFQVGLAASYKFAADWFSYILFALGPACVESLYSYLASCSMITFIMFLTGPAICSIVRREKWPDLPQWLWGLVVLAIAVFGMGSILDLAVSARVVLLMGDYG